VLCLLSQQGCAVPPLRIFNIETVMNYRSRLAQVIHFFHLSFLVSSFIFHFSFPDMKALRGLRGVRGLRDVRLAPVATSSCQFLYFSPPTHAPAALAPARRLSTNNPAQQHWRSSLWQMHRRCGLATDSDKDGAKDKNVKAKKAATDNEEGFLIFVICLAVYS
jgi:hypothetical protein